MVEEIPQVEELIARGINVSTFCERIIRAWLRKDLPRAYGKPNEKVKLIREIRKLIKKRKAIIEDLIKKERIERNLYAKTGDPKHLANAIGYVRVRGGHTSFLKSCLEPYLDFWIKEYTRETVVEMEEIGVDQEDPTVTIYFNPRDKRYYGIREGRIVKVSNEIEFEIRLSLETERSPHAKSLPFKVELYARTKVKNLSLRELIDLQVKMGEKLNEWAKYHFPIVVMGNVLMETSMFSNVTSDFVMKEGVLYHFMKPKTNVYYPLAYVFVEKKQPEYRRYPAENSYLVNLETMKSSLSSVDITPEIISEEEEEEAERKRRGLREIL
jgi:hypothetical protein